MFFCLENMKATLAQLASVKQNMQQKKLSKNGNSVESQCLVLCQTTSKADNHNITISPISRFVFGPIPQMLFKCNSKDPMLKYLIFVIYDYEYY